MKKLLYSAALFAATLIGFTSCDKDDDSSADVKNEAVGNCTVNMKFLLFDGTKLSEFKTKEIEPESGKIISTSEGIQVQYGNDGISLINITESANGFTCDVKSILVKDEESGDYTVTGFNGYEMKYNGGYNTSTKTLEFYLDWPMDKESIGSCALLLPENADVLKEIATIEDEAATTQKIEELGAKYKYIVRYTCVKN